MEPEDIWNQNNAMLKFYEDPPRHMAMLQAIIAATQARIHNMQVYEPYHVIERSFYGSRIFMNVGSSRNWLTNDQYEMLRTMRSELAQTMRVPDCIIFLNTSPSKCIERIRKNPRPYDLDSDYIRHLDAEYTDWLGGADDIYENENKIEVYQINGDKSMDHIEESLQYLLENNFHLPSEEEGEDDNESFCAKRTNHKWFH